MAQIMDAMDEIKSMSIYQRVCAISSEIGKVKMSLNVATKTDKSGRVINSYKAVSINDVVDSLTPMLEKYRVALIPGSQEILKEEQLVTTTQYGERTQFWVRMRCTFAAVNIDNPEERIIAEGYGDGMDSGDKACGKAMTYARKTALINLFNLSRGDDPDEEKSLEYKRKTASADDIAKAVSLYTEREMETMLMRMGVASVAQLSPEQIRKMIAFKEKVSVTDHDETF